MKKQNEIIKAEKIDFYGQTLLAVKYKGKIYVAMKQIVEGMGLDWAGQQKKLLRDKDKFNCRLMSMVGADGKVREMLSMQIKNFEAWLLTINAQKVRHEIRDTVMKFQKECVSVLRDYYHKGAAINPRFKNKSITTAKAYREFKNFAKNYKILGYGKAQAEIMAVDNLMDQYNYDYPASLGLTKEKVVELITEKYRVEQYDFMDTGLYEWLNAILDDLESWKSKTELNIKGLHDDYVSFCKERNKYHETYNGWQRKIGNIFRDVVRPMRKYGETARRYKFSSLDICRRRFEEFTGQELWPPSHNCLDIH